MATYFPYSLDCQTLLVNEALEQLENKWINRNKGFTFSVIFSEPVKEILDRELRNRNLPELAYTVCFARPAKDRQSIHVDGTNSTTCASLNIPLMGCENSVMEWFSGDYCLVRKNYTDQSGQTVYYQEVVWNTEHEVVNTLELTKSYMVRVDVPHRTTANDHDQRAVLCLRFLGNPTWDQVCSKVQG
jgi:hypothetical protein